VATETALCASCVCFNLRSSLHRMFAAETRVIVSRIRLPCVWLCANVLGPAACVYVGDSPEDLEMARRAGVRPIAVLGPFPTRSPPPGRQTRASSGLITELPEALLQL